MEVIFFPSRTKIYSWIIDQGKKGLHYTTKCNAIVDINKNITKILLKNKNKIIDDTIIK